MTKNSKGEGYSIKAKIAAVAVTLTITGAAVVLPFAALADTTADTIAQLQAQIASLTAQLSTLSGSSAAKTTTTSAMTTTTKCTFTRPLKVGSKGDDVKCLQQTLNAGGYPVAASGAGSPGNETTTFGPATKAAVMKWQVAAGVSPAVGYFGTLSQAKYNSMSATATTTTTTTPATTTTTTTTSTTVSGPVGSGLTVTTAVDQPASALAPASAARVPFTKVIFTASADGDVRVNNVTVERQGAGSDSGLTEVLLLDDGYLQYGLAKTLNSLHQANLNEPFVVAAGTSRAFYIAGNRAASGTSVSGEIIRLAVVNVDAGTTKVNATYPISGNGMTMNTTLTIGSLTNQTGSYKVVATTTEDIGKTAFVFTSVRVTAGSQEKVLLQGVRWNQVGSIGQSDIANVKTTVEPVGGTKTDYVATVSADGKYYTSRFGSGIELDKGQSAEIYIKADIISGSNRTIKFDLYRTSDLAVVGQTYGFGITPPTSGTGFASSNPWYFGSQITVSKGTLNVENSTTVPSGNVAVNLSGQPIGAFTADVRGEQVSVASLVFNLGVAGTGSATDLTNLSIYDENGKVVAGPKDGASAHTVTFSDTITFPTGKHVYTLKGKYGTNFASNDTVQASTTPSSDWTTVRGVTTGETVSPTPTSAVSLSTMTVKAAALTLSVSSDPPKQNVVSGAQKFTFAKYLLDATASGEDIRMPSIPLDYSGTTATNLTSCQLYDGATALNTGSNILNPSTNASSTVVTFDGSGFTIPKGTVKTLDMKCNIASGATGTYVWTYTSASSPTATGLTSGQSATITENTSAGQLMTLAASGTFTVLLDSSSPAYAITSAGRTAVPVSVLRFTATNEAVRLTDVALILTGNVASSSPADVTKVTLWDGASKVGETVFVGKSYVASTTLGTCSGCTDFIIPKNDSKLMTVKVDLGAQGTAQAGLPGALVQVDWDNASGNATKGTGIASGASVQRTSGTTTASAGVRIYKSYPTLALVDLPTTKLVSGRVPIFRFKVTAAPEGDVGIAKFTFRIATSSATAQADMIDNVNIYVFTDSSYSTVATGVQTDGAISSTNLTVGDTGATQNAKWATSSTDLELWAESASNASTTVAIPAGTTRYFEIRGDATTAGTQFNVSTQLQGDGKFVANLGGGGAGPYCVTTGCNNVASTTYMATTSFIHSLVNNGTASNNFVWRPFSTTTAINAAGGVLTDIDYSTGYGITGLPTSNTNSQVLTQ